MSNTRQRYFFHAAFCGTAYHGWQKQVNAPSVQKTIEQCLEKVVKQPIALVGCGRTDAGVHASQFFFHADLPDFWDGPLLLTRLNQALPPDISLFDQVPVPIRAHARFDAVQRQYDYYFHTQKDAFLAGNSSYIAHYRFNVEQMRAAVAILPHYDDYRAFSRKPDKQEHTICRVEAARLWMDESGTRFRFSIVSNRFLRGMIRIIMGRLFEVGTGAMSVETFEAHLRERSTPKLIRPAQPEGLYLSKLIYPYLDLPARPPIIDGVEWK
jgi:tRNA pseudouridine38-40 synthase